MRFANFFRSLFSWLLATLVVCAGLIAFFLYQRGDEELRTFLEQSISNSCPYLDLDIGSAKFLPGEGIRLRHVSIGESSTNQGQFPVVVAYCEEAVIECDTAIHKVIDGDIEIHRVVLRGLTIEAHRAHDGTWNLAQFLPKEPKELLPIIQLENCTIRITDDSVAGAPPLVIQGVRAELSQNYERKLKFQATGHGEFFS